MDEAQIQESIDTQQDTVQDTATHTESENPHMQSGQERQETPQQLNFRRLKEEKERLDRENKELLRMIQQQKQPEQQPSEDLDDIADKKYVNKKLQKLEEEIIETRIRSQYPDYYDVVNNDNIARLNEQYPEVAASLKDSNNVYRKAVSAYTLIKKLGIAQEDPYKADKEIAQRNAAKPKPLASVSPQQGESPLSRANAFAQGLTPELRAQLWKEMQESRKQ